MQQEVMFFTNIQKEIEITAMEQLLDESVEQKEENTNNEQCEERTKEANLSNTSSNQNGTSLCNNKKMKKDFKVLDMFAGKLKTYFADNCLEIIYADDVVFQKISCYLEEFFSLNNDEENYDGCEHRIKDIQQAIEAEEKGIASMRHYLSKIYKKIKAQYPAIPFWNKKSTICLLKAIKSNSKTVTQQEDKRAVESSLPHFESETEVRKLSKTIDKLKGENEKLKGENEELKKSKKHAEGEVERIRAEGKNLANSKESRVETRSAADDQKLKFLEEIVKACNSAKAEVDATERLKCLDSILTKVIQFSGKN